MTQQKIISKISDEILTYLLEQKKRNPSFTFSLRSRNSPRSKEKRLENGQWFQGSHYIYVPFFKKGDSRNKTKTFGFVINFDEEKIVTNYIEIVLKGANEPVPDKNFHRELAKKLKVPLVGSSIHGFKYYNNPEKYIQNLQDFIDNALPTAKSLLKKYNIENKYIVPEAEFQKNLNRIKMIKEKNSGITEKLNNLIKLLKAKKQIILQGPPGTGKTYTAKDIAEGIIFGKISSNKKDQKKALEDSGQFELIQFHPAYTYEDFVRSLTAKSVDGQIEYVTENKVIGNFAAKAYENYNLSKKDEKEISKEQKTEKPLLDNYVLIIDEINRANLPAVLGELIYALEYRGEAVNSMYSIDGDPTIIIPENLFIIGTMNTADRSVGHIDYAIRRRFAFENLFPNVDIIETDKGKEYFKITEKLFNNDNLSPDYKNSQEDVQIGHSYFMGEEENLKMRMKYEVIPILREYLKDGIFKEEARGEIDQFETIIRS